MPSLTQLSSRTSPSQSRARSLLSVNSHQSEICLCSLCQLTLNSYGQIGKYGEIRSQLNNSGADTGNRLRRDYLSEPAYFICHRSGPALRLLANGGAAHRRE